MTNKIFEDSKQLASYQICQDLSVDVSKIGTTTAQIGTVLLISPLPLHWISGVLFVDSISAFAEKHGPFSVQVVDSVEAYAELMASIFDFAQMRVLIKGEVTGSPFRVLIDAMHGGESVGGTHAYEKEMEN